MMNIIKAKDRHFNDLGWLQTYWLFSFSNYHDPQNTRHGTLCVFNDDIVQSQTGFGTHPHQEMEIISIILDGEMIHKDSMGNQMVVKQHDVQRMTAGTGLQHSEWNEGNDTVAFFQIWILPDRKGLTPSYDQKNFAPEYWQNRLALIASCLPREEAVVLNSEALIYRADLDPHRELSYKFGNDKCLFLYVIEGELLVNGKNVEKRDQVRIDNDVLLEIKAQKKSDFILIDVPGKSRIESEGELK